ncbi:Zinc finger protein SNAI2 [Armadillidium nasatum]|uniref:Zinc finger protein SNAI2 n=1 Tax=Armadillidium nasatum TaxID=96803 RepID=A0A5N5SZQ3_9CRUS|nr:Zinc finger protein SNAI2 [Armadillidium nasatum]
MVKRNYAHCPLKKRPLTLYNEPASVPEQDEPEDLSVKRPRFSSPPPPEVRPTVTFSPPQHCDRVNTLSYLEVSRPQNINNATPANYPRIPTPVQEPHCESNTVQVSQNYFYNPNTPILNPTPVKFDLNIMSDSSYNKYKSSQPPQSQENMPTLAEYYLQLFKATSEAENKSSPSSNTFLPSSTYLPPSPQNSPVSHDVSGCSPHSSGVIHQYYSSPVPPYPETSALISPVSTCSSVTSESEEETSNTCQRTGGSRSAKYSCDSCGKSYSTHSGLRKHNELHCSSLGPKAFSCKHCAKAYTSIGALKMHIRTHTLPCKCHVCGKAFSRPWLLQGHIRTHTGEKPFECQQCHRSFADRSNLRAHQQTHERIKKYACQTCKKTFSRMSLLNKHMENACVGIKISSPSVSSTPMPY